jgi:hypothetical protein
MKSMKKRVEGSTCRAGEETMVTEREGWRREGDIYCGEWREKGR